MRNATLDEALEIAGESQFAYLATARGGQPRIRPILPAWDNGAWWIAATTDSPKMRDIADNNRVELFWHLTDTFRHLTVKGIAEEETDLGVKKRMWDVIDVDLSGYYGEPESEFYGLMKITPVRIECWSLSEMRGGVQPRVWKP